MGHELGGFTQILKKNYIGQRKLEQIGNCVIPSNTTTPRTAGLKPKEI
jgi:hypothetical protein